MFWKKQTAKKLNRYERAIMLNEEIFKALFVAIILFNAFLPLFRPFSLGFTDFFQWVIVGIHGWGVYNALGHRISWVLELAKEATQSTPIVSIIVLRVIQWWWWKEEIDYLVWGILIACDIGFIVMSLLDKSSYWYEVE